jgi:DNA polymerase-3 subunit alpha
MDDGAGAPALTVTIPHGDEWDKSTLLTFEREMLGLYVSSHPLDGAERILERNRDATTAEVSEGGRQGMVRLAGLISGLTRKVTNQGNAWAIIKLEDLDGSLEVLFFPSSYQLYSAALAEDVVVSVMGKINERDGSVSVNAQEMQVLDVSSATGTEPPVVISVPTTKINPENIRELKRILKAHPGDVPVHLACMTHGGRGTLYNLELFQVRPDPAFFGDVKSLFGANAVHQYQ